MLILYASVVANLSKVVLVISVANHRYNQVNWSRSVVQNRMHGGHDYECMFCTVRVLSKRI